MSDIIKQTKERGLPLQIMAYIAFFLIGKNYPQGIDRKDNEEFLTDLLVLIDDYCRFTYGFRVVVNEE